jgi:FeS assembly protein IscX
LTLDARIAREAFSENKNFDTEENLKMPPSFDWDDLEDIAIALTDKYPDTDPLTVRFTDMHKWITELPLFTGDPAASNESKLEAIQMAWHEEFQERQK